jgi:hypothetical protein
MKPKNAARKTTKSKAASKTAKAEAVRKTTKPKAASKANSLLEAVVLLKAVRKANAVLEPPAQLKAALEAIQQQKKARSHADSPFKKLPSNASFRASVRRCTRVGQRSGVLVEDLGVVPDKIHHMTKNDVLNENIDLMHRAGEMLAAMPAQVLSAKVKRAGVSKTVALTTRNIGRLEFFLNSRPYRSLDVNDGTTSIDLPPMQGVSNSLEVQGFRENELVASTRLSLT